MIREMSPTNDLPMLLRLEEATQLAPWSAAAFQRCFDAGYPGWVVLDAKTHAIVGFIMVSLIAGECHILNLCVNPSHQRQGLGRQLLEFSLEWAKKEGAMMAYLEVRKSNSPAIQLYLHMNFKQIGERKNYYPALHGKKEDALVYARDIGMEVYLEQEFAPIDKFPPLKKDK